MPHYLIECNIPGAGTLPLAALVLFAVDVVLSRWWLPQYRYGPLHLKTGTDESGSRPATFRLAPRYPAE